MGLSSKLISGDWVHTQSEADTYEPRISHEMKRKPQSEPMMKCPRCHSTNTKFCYYNNYTKSQPRHFCRSCKRHWTQGGSLRNVPVGGGHKNKRLKTQTTTAKAAAATSATTEEDTSFLHKDLSYNNGGYGAFEGLFQFPIPNKSLQIPHPSISSFESDPSSCYHRGDPETEATESSTMASSVFTTSDAVDARCWGLDDIGAFVPVDLGLPWEDY